MQPNFVKIFYQPRIKSQRQIYFGGILLFLLVLLVIFLPSQWFFRAGIAFILLFLFFAFLNRLELGLYVLIAVCFFSGWEIVVGRYGWARNISYLSSINAPLMDFVGLALGFSLLVSWLANQYKINWTRLGYLLVPTAFYVLFILFAFVSALQAYDHEVPTSLKYLARNLLFVYLIYLLLPNILLKTRTMLDKILKIWFGVGVIISLFGLSSLVVISSQGWPRVVPYGLGSFAPLGYNHNLIAEALVPIIPLVFYLILKAKQQVQPTKVKIYAVGLVLILLAELLTLSRAGWVSLAVELLVASYFFGAQIKQYLAAKKELWLPAAMVGLLILSYMAIFLGSNMVKSSNISRLRTTDVVLFYAARAPLFGYGPGMYMPILTATQDFTMDFGDPLDAHGFMQKILLENGIIGLFLFVFTLLYIIRYVGQTLSVSDSADRLLLILLLVSVVGAITFQLFNTSYFKAVLWLPVGLALATAGLVRNKIL